MSKEVWNITELGKRKSEEGAGNTTPRYLVVGHLEKSKDSTVAEIADATNLSLSDTRVKLFQLKGEGWAVKGDAGDDDDFWL
jgi:hypothetical protein